MKNNFKSLLGLTKRNLLLFFKDKQSVLFSLLTSMIVLALYLLFLKGTFIDALNQVVNEYAVLASNITEEEIDMFANLILLTGILGSAMITVPYNCLTTVVKDRENKIDYDILATPMKRANIVLSYFFSAAISSIILTGIILAAGFIVIRFQGDLYLSVKDVMKAFGVVALGSVSATAIFMIVVLCFKSSAASGAFFGMLSAACGFVIGAYIPISQFSDSVQTICNVFPASHVTILLRNVLINGLLDHMDESLAGMDGGTFASTIRDMFSFKAHMFDFDCEIHQMILYILAFLVLSIIAQVIIYSKTYKK